MNEYLIEAWNKVDIHRGSVLKIPIIVGNESVIIACGCGAGGIAGRNGLKTG
jgi:hypothetical protein